MRTDAAGLAFIAREEGTSLAPYPDSRGFATIFVGHLIRMGPVRASDWHTYAPLTRQHAMVYLAQDVALAEAEIRRDVHVPLNQNEFNALVSITFNIGIYGFRGSTVLRRLNAGDRRGAAKAFEMWHIGGAGLMGRRLREERLFLTPVSGTPAPTLPGADLTVLKSDEASWVRELDQLRRRHQDVARRKQLVGLVTVRRDQIHAAALRHGWDHHHWRERYAILLSRTKKR